MSQGFIESKTVSYAFMGNLPKEDIQPGLTISLDEPPQTNILVELLSEDITPN